MNEEKVQLVVQQWIECQGEQVVGVNGYSIHLNEKDKQDFCDRFWEREKKSWYQGRFPTNYVREEGIPITVFTPRKDLFDRLMELRKEEKYGIMIVTIDMLQLDA